MYLTTFEELVDFTEKLRDCKTLAIDTEFVREKTYFHRLGLIQVGGNGLSAAIDPIKIKNLDPLLELFKQTDKLKVFHAGKQDLEIIYRLCGEAIRPVFDTQVAASMIGWGAQISFAKIVYKATGKKIRKSETYSDWCRRPLSDNQIEYALNDVVYLMPVYEKIVKRLEKLKRLDWVNDELKHLTDPENFKLPDPRQQFMKIKNYRTLKSRNLAVLRELAAWREGVARERDCLAKAVVRDEPLLEMARTHPKTVEKLGQIRGFHPREATNSGPAILATIERGMALPEDQFPVLPESNSYSTGRGVEELIAAFVQIRSEEIKIEPHMLADRKMIHSFVTCHEQNLSFEDHPLYQGWRKGLIGDDLHMILQGQMGLAVNSNGKVNLIPNPKS